MFDDDHEDLDAPLIFDDGSSSDDFDSPAEVEAAFRAQRRVALSYAGLFGVVILAVPALSLVVGWWSDSRLLVGMSPAFGMAAVGLYLVFFVIALSARSLADDVEDQMLGGPPTEGPGDDAR